jgi:ligand-binding SRPBCC domain-containing protein
MATGQFTVSSRLAAPAEEVWAGVTTAEGVNAELKPLLRMTVPRGLDDFSIADVEDGTTLGRSWILLFGLIPFDYDDIHVERIEPGRAFHERSTMLTQRRWEHDRSVEPDGETACMVTDSVLFEPRLPVPPALLRPLLHAFFRRRHRRLRRRFGT